MMNDYDERYDVEDFDEDIRLREALVEEAKQMEADADWNEINRAILNLRRQWRKIPFRDSAYEEELSQQFDAVLDALYAKRNEGYLDNIQLKQDLIKQANALQDAPNLNQATEQMNELMKQWKAVGSAGKEKDNELWEAFNGARQTFFDRKHQHWENLQEKFSNARTVKEELIQKAEALCDSEAFNQTSEEFRRLMDEWKAVGSAGREYEDALWQKFNEHRQRFYDRRSKFYDEMRELQAVNIEKKEALIQQARAILDQHEFTREHTSAMKQLGVDWKAIGSCGKEKEDEIWKEFRSLMDAYFQGLQEFNEQKQLQWRNRMIEIRTRKQEMIQKQKHLIKRMEEDKVGLLGQRAIDEMEEDIEDKKEFIKELEEELADIEKKLNQ